MATKKYVYFFGSGKAEGQGDMKDLLGGKGAGLAEMTNLGVPVPAGFTISTEACVAYFKNKRKYPPGLWEEVLRYEAPGIDHGVEVWRSVEPSAGLGTIRRAGLHAGNDGYRAESGAE